jgi:hypothetical protein
MAQFTARNKPRGTFARSRRDWSVEHLQSGGGNLDTSGAFDFAYYFLFNNDDQGRYLAVYSIFAFFPAGQEIDLAFTLGIDGSAGVFPGMMNKFDAPQEPGLTAVVLNTSAQLQGGTSYGGGATPLVLDDDTPLFLIPQGYSLVVSGPTKSPGSVASFLWAPY